MPGKTLDVFKTDLEQIGSIEGEFSGKFLQKISLKKTFFYWVRTSVQYNIYDFWIWNDPYMRDHLKEKCQVHTETVMKICVNEAVSIRRIENKSFKIRSITTQGLIEW